tara:strand:- start:417 stop:563 length:147 start_codon:yes stop_codon:yes gene_type:complete
MTFGQVPLFGTGGPARHCHSGGPARSIQAGLPDFVVQAGLLCDPMIGA